MPRVRSLPQRGATRAHHLWYDTRAGGNDMRTQIIGSGFVTGEHLVTNEVLGQMMDTSDEWIRERSGVETRYYVEQARTVLLVGAEVHSGFMPWTKWDYLFGRGGEPPTESERAVATRFRDRTVLFGDAGGAVVLRQGDDERGLLGFQVHSDGANFQD